MSKHLLVGIFSNTVLGDTGSVEGSSYWYFEVLGQYKAVMVGTWCFWVSRGRYWLSLGGTGSVYCSTGWYLVILGQNRAVLVASVV